MRTLTEEDQLYFLVAISFTATVFACGFLKRHRRFNIRPMNRNRSKHSVYEKLVKFAANHDHELFFKYTRMSPEMFRYLLDMIKPHIKRDKTKNPISVGQRLAITLHYLAEGCSMQEIAWNNYIGKSTTHYIITETCELIWTVLAPIVIPPPTSEDLKKVALENFRRWNLPNCIGSIDGKHVDIQCPSYSGTTFFSYKKSFSMVIMAACDSYYKFTFVDIGAPGSNHDSSIFKEASYGKALLDGTLDIPAASRLPRSNIVLPHFFVADQAFPLHKNIMRPYPGNYLDDTKRIFNMRLSRVRRTIENSFGILAQRWRRLRSPIIANVKNCESIIKACIVLHNFVQKGEQDIPVHERRYCPTGFADWEDAEGVLHDGSWRAMAGHLRPVGRLGANNTSRVVQENRDKLARYLISPAGSVGYQYNYIHEGGAPDSFLK